MSGKNGDAAKAHDSQHGLEVVPSIR